MNTTTTHWLRFRHEGREHFGTLEGDTVSVRTGDLFGESAPTGASVPVSAIEWLTPTRPGKFVCVWNNFRASAEKQGLAIPGEPLYAIKATSACLPHRGPIQAPGAYEGRVIYEGELGVVIGRRCRNASQDQAAAAIFGYTCVNDVTALELIGRDPSFAQWTRAKSFDTFGVFGPVIATGLDPAALVVRTLVNGRERQNYPIADIVFPPVELVRLLSQDMTLEPGDLIACGTSLGVLPMKPGMRVAVSIDGIGTLENEYVEAAA